MIVGNSTACAPSVPIAGMSARSLDSPVFRLFAAGGAAGAGSIAASFAACFGLSETSNESPTLDPRNRSLGVIKHIPLESTAPPARLSAIAPRSARRLPSTLSVRSISAPCFVVSKTCRSLTAAACAESSSTLTPTALSVPARRANAAGGFARLGSSAAAFPEVVASAAASAAAFAAFIAAGSRETRSPPARGFSANARDESWLSCATKF